MDVPNFESCFESSHWDSSAVPVDVRRERFGESTACLWLLRASMSVVFLNFDVHWTRDGASRAFLDCPLLLDCSTASTRGFVGDPYVAGDPRQRCFLDRSDVGRLRALCWVTFP